MTPARRTSPLIVLSAAATSGRLLVATSVLPWYGTEATNVRPFELPRTSSPDEGAGTIRRRTFSCLPSRSRLAGVARRAAVRASVRTSCSAWLRKTFWDRSENWATTIAVEVAATTANAAPSHQRTPMNRRVMPKS